MTKMVKMYNKETGGEFMAPAASVDHWKTKGWRTTKPKSKPTENEASTSLKEDATD